MWVGLSDNLWVVDADWHFESEWGKCQSHTVILVGVDGGLSPEV